MSKVALAIVALTMVLSTLPETHATAQISVNAAAGIVAANAAERALDAPSGAAAAKNPMNVLGDGVTSPVDVGGSGMDLNSDGFPRIGVRFQPPPVRNIGLAPPNLNRASVLRTLDAGIVRPPFISDVGFGDISDAERHLAMSQTLLEQSRRRVEVDEDKLKEANAFLAADQAAVTKAQSVLASDKQQIAKTEAAIAAEKARLAKAVHAYGERLVAATSGANASGSSGAASSSSSSSPASATSAAAAARFRAIRPTAASMMIANLKSQIAAAERQRDAIARVRASLH